MYGAGRDTDHRNPQTNERARGSREAAGSGDEGGAADIESCSRSSQLNPSPLFTQPQRRSLALFNTEKIKTVPAIVGRSTRSAVANALSGEIGFRVETTKSRSPERVAINEGKHEYNSLRYLIIITYKTNGNELMIDQCWESTK